MAGFLIFCIFVHVTFAAVFDPFNPDLFFKTPLQVSVSGVGQGCMSQRAVKTADTY